MRRILLADGASPRDAAFWDSLTPGLWLVEIGCATPPSHGPNQLLADFAAESAMAVSLRTDAILQCNAGPALVLRLAQYGCHLGDMAALALHEVLLNAAIHGNLRVASQLAAVWQDRDAQIHHIETALADPSLAARAVTVALGWNEFELCAAVMDCGDGYRAGAPDGALPGAPRQASGRGLMIVRAAAHMEVRHGGRCARLIFPCVTTSGAG